MEPSLSSANNRIADDEVPISALLAPLRRHWLKLLGLPIAAGALALCASFLITPTYTARVMLMPPQGQQSGASAALASLGGLAGIAGLPAARTPADQLATLLQSATVEKRLVERFELKRVYEKDLMVDAQERLRASTTVSAGRKDGLITLEVDDTSPQRAADLANGYVQELRRLNSTLAVTEAQQRRAFFENEVKQTLTRLTQAQMELGESGLNIATLKAEPKSAAEGYAKLRAEVTAMEVRLQTLRGTLADSAAEVRQASSRLSALRSQLAQLEAREPTAEGPAYIDRYREYKYQEALFEFFSKQYELARIDESREGALIQVIDTATPPERKSAPKRGRIALLASLVTFLLLTGSLLSREIWRLSSATKRA